MLYSQRNISISMTKHKIINVLKYWHMEEFLLPQTLEPAEKLNNENQQSFTGTIEHILEKVQELNKHNIHSKSDNDYIWEFVIYGLIYKIEDIKVTLLSILKVDDDFEERVQIGNAASYAISFNSELKFKIDGLQVSTAPWAIKNIVKDKKLTHLDYKNFQFLENEIKVEFNENSTLDEYEFRSFLLYANNVLKEHVGMELVKSDNYFQVVAKRKMRKNIEIEQSDTDLLNSFYIEDLNATIEYVENGGNNKLLNQYLEMDTIPKRIDIRRDLNYVYNMLSPDKLPDACWPAEGSYPLVYSQQFAINSINERLMTSSGIYSVNGPPGTGKTTMLRDLIASVITNRAKEIAKLDNPKDMFKHIKSDKAWKNNDDQQWYKKLKNEFLGHEIVVASSNNGAVENITMEIPSINSIDEKWLEKINYFSDIGTGLIGANAWGSGAACFGNSLNKSKFIGNFWNGSKNKDNIQLDGFATYFKKIIDTNVDNIAFEEKINNWREAKKEFIDAINIVEQYKKEKMLIKELPDKIDNQINNLVKLYNETMNKYINVEKEINLVQNKINEFVKTIKKINEKIDTLNNILMDKEKNYKSLDKKINNKKVEINEWYIRKPSIIDIILTLGKSWKKWNSKKDILEEDEQKLEISIKEADKIIKDYVSAIKKEQHQFNKNVIEENSFKEKLITLINTFKNIKIEIEKIKEQCTIKKDEKIKAIDLLYKQEKRNDNESSREKASPWTHDIDFQNARTVVFIKALNLHKALIDVNAKEIRMNLFRMMEILGNKVKKGTKHEEAVHHCWATLFLCVPVVSTTFASFDRLFSQLWDNKIGWLLIDEAGQASTKAAIGAIMRSQRVVVVGDPLQLEPIVGLPATVQEILHKEIDAHDMAFSEHTSVQKRADFTEVHGTYLESDEDNNIWVGSPLRVHRRCYSPMFDISNKTTYKGLMVQGKGVDNCSLEKSTWYDVCSSTANGHWIEEEGLQAIELIKNLLLQGVEKNDIYLISPFRDVVNGLKNIFRKNKLIDVNKRVGTIHTVQGKEAKVVVLVLGSSPENNGARLWAASKPNLLNVAATRAKDRLYIIGNKSKWKDKQYFKDAIDLLC